MPTTTTTTTTTPAPRLPEEPGNTPSGSTLYPLPAHSDAPVVSWNDRGSSLLSSGVIRSVAINTPSNQYKPVYGVKDTLVTLKKGT